MPIVTGALDIRQRKMINVLMQASGTDVVDTRYRTRRHMTIWLLSKLVTG